MELERQVGLIEAILLRENEPMELGALQRISGLEREEVLRALDFLREEYRKDLHGFELVEIGGGFSLSPKQPLWVDLRERYGGAMRAGCPGRPWKPSPSSPIPSPSPR